MGLHDFLVGAGCFGEGQFLADDGAKRGVFEAGEDGGMGVGSGVRGNGPQGEGMDGGFAGHEVARGDGDVAAAADDHDAAVLGEKLEVGAEVDVGEHLEDDVHAAAGGGFEDGVRVAGGAVVEGMVRALAFDEVEALRGARGADHRHACRAGELHGGDADAAAGAVDEDGFRGAGVGELAKGAVGGGVGDVDARALGKTEAHGEGMHLGFEGHGVFGAGAGERAGGVDAVAGLDAGDARAGGLDGAGGVHARSVGERGFEGVVAAAHVGVGGIDAGGVHADENLAGFGLWRGNFFELHHFRRAEFMHANGFHGVTPSWKCVPGSSGP